MNIKNRYLNFLSNYIEQKIQFELYERNFFNKGVTAYGNLHINNYCYRFYYSDYSLFIVEKAIFCKKIQIISQILNKDHEKFRKKLIKISVSF